MPRKRKNGLDMVDDIVDVAVDSLFERGTEFFSRMREQRMQHARELPSGTAREVYTCAACRKKLGLVDMEMVNPINEFGMCRGCFAFVWNAGQEKVKFLARKAKEAAEARARTAAQSPPAAPRRPPWEVLGVSAEATADEIGKAWRKLAAQYHPDRINGDPKTTDAEREQARAMFDELTRCRDAMLKVRKAATGPA